MARNCTSTPGILVMQCAIESCDVVQDYGPKGPLLISAADLCACACVPPTSESAKFLAVLSLVSFHCAAEPRSTSMPNVRGSMDFLEQWRSLWEADLEALAFNGATCDPTRVDPKVLQWVKSNCARKPHFVKVINPSAVHGWRRPPGSRRNGHEQCKLHVPRPFVREHFMRLGRVVTLENCATREKWKVSFGAPRKVPSWLQGWKRVATGNKLTPGDVMVFILEGHSHFLFHLFDEHGRPKPQLPPGREQHHDSALKIDPTGNLQHCQEEDGPADAEHNLCNVKKRTPFDADIVKAEPGTIFQPGGDGATNSTAEAFNGYHGDPRQTSTAKKLDIRTGIGSLPDSELTVSGSGEEMISRGKARCIENAAQQWIERSKEAVVEPKLRDVDCNGTKIKVHESSLDPMAFIIKSRRRMVTVTEKKRAWDAAKAHAELLVGYRFMVVLSADQVYRDFYVTLPERFASDTGLSPAVTRLRLVDSNGLSWRMYSKMSSGGEVAFHRKYWGVFSLEHLMEEGDACVFQLKNKDSRTLFVRIFRVVQLLKIKDRTNFSVHDHFDMRLRNQQNSDV